MSNIDPNVPASQGEGENPAAVPDEAGGARVSFAAQDPEPSAERLTAPGETAEPAAPLVSVMPGRASTSLSILSGIVVAIVAAVLWAVLVEVSGWKVGVGAIGVGVLVGFAMRYFASTSRALPLIAGVIALAACIFGDFLADAADVAKYYRISGQRVATVMFQHPDTIGPVFQAGFKAMDALFWAIAAYAAYGQVRRAVALRTFLAGSGAAPLGAGASTLVNSGSSSGASTGSSTGTSPGAKSSFSASGPGHAPLQEGPGHAPVPGDR